jgi:hypothetical protein
MTRVALSIRFVLLSIIVSFSLLRNVPIFHRTPAALWALLLLTSAGVARAQVNVTTYHNDNSRTGQNTQETVLTHAVFKSAFGKLFSVTVNGYVYAQPLVLSNVSIGGGTHNVVYVATEHDSVYAIDADNGAVYWQKSFLGSGITTVSDSDINGCNNIAPEVGITSTPVIDGGTGTIYVVAKTKENGTFVQRLHALSVGSGAEKFGGPKIILAAGFDPLKQLNRPGLLLENGHLVIAFGSHCDWPTYYGWVMSYSASTLAQEAVFNAAPNGTDGKNAAVWMSGGGVAADASGNLYFATGNGTYDDGTSTPVDFGDSVVRLNPPSGGAFSVADWFTPWNQINLKTSDWDLGSGGLLLLPDLPPGSPHRQLLVQMGKEGKIYLVDRNNMGRHCEGCSQDTNIVQEITGATVGVWGAPAYWNGYVYWGAAWDSGSGDNLKAFSFNANNSGLISTAPTSRSAEVFSFPGPSPSVSAFGITKGILWALDNSGFASGWPAVLHAYDATNPILLEPEAAEYPWLAGCPRSRSSSSRGDLFVLCGQPRGQQPVGLRLPIFDRWGERLDDTV